MNIKITPKKLCGEVTAPSSKSVLHRMLICASLADKKSEIKCNGISDDIKATARCLNSLGAGIILSENLITVEPIKVIPKSAMLDCGESGSTLRFMLALCSALGVNTEFTGHGRLPSRPNEPLLKALTSHGITVNNRFPIEITGQLRSGMFEINGNISSQFITALLLSLPLCDGESTVKIIPPIESKSYIDLTVDVMKNFGVKIEQNGNKFFIKKSKYCGGNFVAEGDWSNSAFWLTAGIKINGLDKNSIQADKKIQQILNKNPAEIDAQNIPDIVPIIAIFCATKNQTTRIYNASRLRIKESDRIKSTVEMLNNLGVNAEGKNDEILIYSNGKLSGGTVNSYNDHRIAMASAIGACFCKNPVTIIGAEAVNKSYPEFFKIYNSLGGQADVV